MLIRASEKNYGVCVSVCACVSFSCKRVSVLVYWYSIYVCVHVCVCKLTHYVCVCMCGKNYKYQPLLIDEKSEDPRRIRSPRSPSVNVISIKSSKIIFNPKRLEVIGDSLELSQEDTLDQDDIDCGNEINHCGLIPHCKMSFVNSIIQVWNFFNTHPRHSRPWSITSSKGLWDLFLNNPHQVPVKKGVRFWDKVSKEAHPAGLDSV